MKKITWLCVGVLCAWLPMQAIAEEKEPITMYIGESTMLTVNNPSRIVIGKPSVADVSNVTKAELTLTAKSVGKTTLVYWDTFGESSYEIRVLTEDMADAQRRIDNLLASLDLPEVYTQAENEEGKVLLLGRVKTAQDKEKLNVALGVLREKATDLISIQEEESVVEIDVQVLELNKDVSSTLGFGWPGSINITEQGSPAIRTSSLEQVGTTDTISGGTATGTKWGSLFRVLNVSREAFTLTIDALEQEGKAKILSRPRLACQSGKEAELLVGGEKPIFTTQIATSGGSSQGTEVEYKEFGIKLKIKPTVTDKAQIKLGLNIEVSEVGAAEIIGSANAPTAKAYPLSKRTVSTELFLSNDQVLAIGGLIKQKEEEDIRKTPFLGDIPILGAIFRKKSAKIGGGQGERGNTELFVTLTPHIVSSAKAAAAGSSSSRQMIQPTSQELEDMIMPQTLPVPAASLQPRARAPLPQTDLFAPEAKYAAIVQRRILEHLTYPQSAKIASFQGQVKLRMLLASNGELLDVMVKDSSGYKSLDDNTIAIAKSIRTYPPFPPAIVKKEIWVEVPIVYSLD